MAQFPAIPSRKPAIIKEYASAYANGIAYPKSDVDVRGFLPAFSLPASRPLKADEAILQSRRSPADNAAQIDVHWSEPDLAFDPRFIER
jgi:hypothetical protein